MSASFITHRYVNALSSSLSCLFSFLTKKSILAVFSGVLTPVSEIHHRNTRYASNQNFHRPKTSTTYGQLAFQFCASKFGNQFLEA